MRAHLRVSARAHLLVPSARGLGACRPGLVATSPSLWRLYLPLLQSQPRLGRVTHRHYSVPHSTDPQLYSVLGLTPAATSQQIKDAYRELSKVLHPDRNKGSAESHAQFSRINEAYQTLGNYESRSRYDRYMGLNRQATAGGSTVDPANVGRTASMNYNFDEWQRRHYAEKARHTHMKKEAREAANARKQNSFNQLLVFLVGAGLAVWAKRMHDSQSERIMHMPEKETEKLGRRKSTDALRRNSTDRIV